MTRALSTLCGLALLAATATDAAAQAGDAALCAGRDPCRVVAGTDAGRDADGRALRIVELALAETRNEQRCQPHRRQFWLLVEGASPRLVLDLCNDGYGSAGIGEDEVEVRPNRLSHWRSGGSAWRWREARLAELSPLRVLTETNDQNWTLGPNIADGEWDWQRFTGRTRWWSPDCEANGGPPPNAYDMQPPDTLPYAYSPIPSFEAASLPAGAAEAELGSCALTVDAGGSNGFVINGAAAPADAPREWMRVMMIGGVSGPRELLVTVGTARWTSGGANWIHDDHVEIWLGPLMGFGSHCLSRTERPRQWGIRIADGRVFPGFGNDRAVPRVFARRERREAGGSIVTLRIALPGEFYNVSVVLARGDGRRQGRMVATSQLRFGRLATLGEAREMSPRAVRCEVRAGRLELAETGRPEWLLDEDR